MPSRQRKLSGWTPPVSIFYAARGPLVMEVNASPGLEGVETTTGVDVAGKMIAWIERQATPEFCLKIGG